MTYLLDTSTFLWAATMPCALSRRARRICESPASSRLVSVASLWEIAVKCGIGKLSIVDPARSLPAWIVNLGAHVLSLDAAHAYAAWGLPLLHKDPFDRMLVAQAITEDLTLVTSDEKIQQYPVKWAW